MTPLLAPEGVTVLKVERVSRGLLDPRTVHYVAGGRYKGIIINRAAKERPEHRTANVRRNFTCYIGAKLRGEPTREQRQLRFWFRHGSSDMEPMADRFFKELINPHLFPRDYIGYVKRILQLLQGYPTVAKMELEMRPARPDEEDQQYVVRRVSRQRSQPPPGIQQDDYHTWHAPPKAGSRGELGSPVGWAPPPDRGYTVERRSRRTGHYSQEDTRSYAQRQGNVISQWPSPAQERQLTTRSPSPGRALDRPPHRHQAHHHSQDAIIAAVNNPAMNRSWDGRRRYSIDSLDSADFRAPVDGYRVYTSSPRVDRKGTPDDEPADLNALLQSMLARGVQEYDYRPPPGYDSSSYHRAPPPSRSLRPVSEILRPTYECSDYADRDAYGDVMTPKSQPNHRLSMTSGSDTKKRRSIRVLKMGRSQTDVNTPPTHHIAELNIPPQNRTEPEGHATPDITPETSRRERSTAFLSLGGSVETEPEVDEVLPIQEQTSDTPETHRPEPEIPPPEPEIEPEIASEVTGALPEDVGWKPPDTSPGDAVESEETGSDVVTEGADDVTNIPNADVIRDQDAGSDLDDAIDELAAQYQIDDIDDAEQDPQTEHVELNLVLPPRGSFNAPPFHNLHDAYRMTKRRRAVSNIEDLVRSGVSIMADRRRVTSLADLENLDDTDISSGNVSSNEMSELRCTYMSGTNPVGATTWRRHEETSHQGYSLTSRSPSPAKVVIRKLPPSPVVTRVKSSPVTIRHTTTQMPVVTTTHTRVLNPPVVSPPQPAHPGLSRRGVQVLWVARRYRVLKLLEDAYPNSVTADELLRYYKIHAGRSTRLVDVVALTSILKWLSIRGLVREVEPGQWMRLETVRTTGHNKWTHSTQMVTELPTLPHMELPQVAIVTLMYAEKLAVDAMIENKKTYVWRRPHDKGEGQVITLGNIGHVRVVSTKLPKPGEGESSMMVARNATSRVIGSFTSVSRVLLVGVAGGIAHFTDDRRHIRRGDIVVCKPKQSRAPMYIYCTGTERSVSGDYRFASRNWVTKDETLENLINSYQIRQRKDSNFCPWERHIREGLVLLQGGDIDFRRPELTTDRLVRFGSDGRPHEVPHPAVRSKSARDLRPGQPMVHYDVIGGGEALLGDYNKRRTFAMLTGAKAIDIGYQPVLEAIEEAQKDSVAIIRGIADYNDGRSDSYWQPYSALAAAAFTKALLLELPVEK